MSRTAFLFGLFLGTVAGILLWPWLVYRQSGAVQERQPMTENRQKLSIAAPWTEPYAEPDFV